jgi:hypothetical protein
MKRLIFITFTLLLLALHIHAAAPMAHLVDAEAAPIKNITEKIAFNKPITYCIYAADNSPENISAYIRYIKLAFAAWTESIAYEIKAHNREKGFKDVYNILSQRVELNKLDNCNMLAFKDLDEGKLLEYLEGPEPVSFETADISFIIDEKFLTEFSKFKAREKNTVFHGVDEDEIEEWHRISFYIRSPIPFIAINPGNAKIDPAKFETFERLVDIITKPEGEKSEIEKDNESYRWWEVYDILAPIDYHTIPTTIMHELGHAFGLADQYESGLDNADVFYATVEPRNGIMGSLNYLSCDDIDGMITRVDRVRGTKRRFNSFCGDNIKFVNGRESLRPSTPGSVSSKVRSYESKYGVKREITVNRKDSRENIFHDRQEHTVNLPQEAQRLVDKFGFDLSYFPQNVKLTIIHDGKYKSEGDKIPPVGRWSNLLIQDDNNYQEVVNVFDEPGKKKSSTLAIISNGKKILEKKLPIEKEKEQAVNEAKKTDAEKMADSLKKSLKNKNDFKINFK